MSWFSTHIKNSLSSSLARLMIVGGLTILYIAAFLVSLHQIGAVAAALIAVPVALTGFYFGVNAGLLAGILGALLSAWLFQITEGANWLTWLIGNWPGTFMTLLVGYMSGRLKQGIDRRIQVEADLRSRERYFALVNIMTQSILSAKTPEDMYYVPASHLKDLFEADYAFIAHWDSAQSQITVISTTLAVEDPIIRRQLGTREAAMIESLLQTGQAVVIENSNSDYEFILSLPTEDTSQPHSAISIPLVSEGYRFGIAAVAFSLAHQFSSEEVSRAAQAGRNLTLALGSIEQKEEIQKRLREANALANIEHALSETERVGLETVLQLIVNSAKELIRNAEQAIIHLLDDEQQLLIPKAVAEEYVAKASTFNMRPGEGAAGLAIESKEVINIQDVTSDPRFLHRGSPPAFRSLLVAPIQRKGQPIGTISVHSGHTHAFSAKDSELINTLSVHAAIAIENTRLLETTQQRLREVNALYRTSQGLAASLDADQLIKDVVTLLQQNFDYYHVQAYLVYPPNGDLILKSSSGPLGDQLLEENGHLPRGMGIVGHVAETGVPFVTNDVNRVVFFARNPLLPDTQSELAVPIKVEGKVVGVVDIQDRPPHRLTEGDLHLMIAVADHLAVALQKANLYSELQHALNQEKAMRLQLVQSEKLAVMGRLLASVSHELNNPLQAIQNALFLLKEERGVSPQGKQDLEIVLSESERMAALIERLRATYRPHQIQDFHQVELNNIIESVFALIATHLRHNEISFEFYPDPELPPFPGLANELREVLLNLMMNAVEAMTNGGRLSVSTQYLPESCEILLTVTDNGPGIDSSILPNIFDAFVTNKASGTGLGLTISYDIVQKHRGRIKAENNPEGGTMFSIWLPVKLGTFDDEEQPYLDH